MIDYFCSLYSNVVDNNKILRKIRFYSLLRFIIRISANLFLPLFFIMTQDNKKYKIENNRGHNRRIIVSLTSFPARINRLWLVIETLLRQSVKPDIIILWLSKKQFSDLKVLPKKLLDLQQRGLVIRFVDDDIRSHKKYFYAFKEFPNDIIVTIDDDVFYQSNILESLIIAYSNNSNAICANHTRLFNNADNKGILNYSDFKIVTRINSVSNKYVQIGIGGVLYPPNSLYKDVLKKDLFMNLAPMADDLWLYTMARLNNTPIFRTTYKGTYLPIINIRNVSLSESNCKNNGNDIQLKNIHDYYVYQKGIDPFI